MASFFHILDSHIPIREGSDRMRWKLKSNGEFTGLSLYEFLWGSPPMSFSCKAIWRAKAPMRFSFFVWTVACGKILTCKNLIKRGYSIVSWCCMCQCSGETMDHFLIHFNVAFKLWSLIFRMFGV